MTIDPNEAGALLREIAGSERRTREVLAYTRAGDQLILWGILWMIGYGLTAISPSHARLIWIAVNAIGMVSSVLITIQSSRRVGIYVSAGMIAQAVVTVCAITAFGVLWVMLSKFGPRELSAFWPTLIGTLYFILGLWVGRALCVLCAFIVLLTLVGYFFVGPWLDLWLAFANGSAMVLAGFWLRR